MSNYSASPRSIFDKSLIDSENNLYIRKTVDIIGKTNKGVIFVSGASSWKQD